MIRRKTKKPQDYTLGEIRKILDTIFPPPWYLLEAITKMEELAAARGRQ